MGGKARRRELDAQRLAALKTGAAYERRLLRYRTATLRTLIKAAGDDLGALEQMIPAIDEAAYLTKWWEGLVLATGTKVADNTFRMLNTQKAARSNIWAETLRRYAQQRAGENIVSVTGTMKDALLGIIRAVMSDEPLKSVYERTREIYRQFVELERWQVRRIARTETMISLGESADMAARTLDIPMLKEWACSGLANTRESHLLVDGTQVEMDEPFELEGGLLMFPHDGSLGADAGEIINCACSCLYVPK